MYSWWRTEWRAPGWSRPAGATTARWRSSPGCTPGRRWPHRRPRDSSMGPEWRPGNDGQGPRAGGPLCADLDVLQADTAADRGGAADRRLRGMEAAAGGGAADRGSDDRRLRRDARRLGARGGGAGHETDGKAALGDPGRRVHLFD